jgi:hypothetical protein
MALADSWRTAVTGVELIVVALAAGVGEGVKDTAKAAVVDAYAALKGLLGRRLAQRPDAQAALEAAVDDPATWHAQLGDDLTVSGADRDQEVLAAAQRLLEAADPAGARVGKYQVTVNDGQDVQIGDATVHVDTNYGATASTMTAPVSINYHGQPPIPPSSPAAP